MAASEPIAHVRPLQNGEWERHALSEHLEQVARLASSFAAPMAAQNWAHLAGLWPG